MNRRLARGRWRTRRMTRRVLRHLRGMIVAGLLMLTPLVVTYLILRFIYNFLADLVVDPLTRLPLFRFIPEVAETWVALGLLAIILYLAGVLTRYALAGRLVTIAHHLLETIPGVGAIYRITRQATEVLAGSTQDRYQRVVIVDFPRKGLKTIGLVTGRTRDSKGRSLLMLYIPTAPNPTSGFTALVPEGEVTATSMSVEDAMKLVVSGGVAIPRRMGVDAFRGHPYNQDKEGGPGP